MSNGETILWHEANQRHLMQAVAAVRRRLQNHGASASDDVVPIEDLPGSPSDAGSFSPPFTLQTMRTAFGLSAFELDLLVLAAGVELDASFAATCAAAQGDPRRTRPTFSLAMAVLPDAHWSAITPSAPLRRWRLIEVSAGIESLQSDPLLESLRDSLRREQPLELPAQCPPDPVSVARCKAIEHQMLDM